MDLDLEETWSKSKKDPPSAFEECHQAECDLMGGDMNFVFHFFLGLSNSERGNLVKSGGKEKLCQTFIFEIGQFD